MADLAKLNPISPLFIVKTVGMKGMLMDSWVVKKVHRDSVPIPFYLYPYLKRPEIKVMGCDLVLDNNDVFFPNLYIKYLCLQT